ncbi:MAG: hypothetical protein QFX40_03480 [Archaeoglobales archaeon]|nr:hypothetical protein [Archaeoglobales archaeon]
MKSHKLKQYPQLQSTKFSEVSFILETKKIRLGESMLSRFEIIPYTLEIARKSAEIDAELMKMEKFFSSATK